MGNADRFVISILFVNIAGLIKHGSAWKIAIGSYLITAIWIGFNYLWSNYDRSK